MKTLKDYIWECTKEYKFRIKLACDCNPSDLKKSISEVLNKFKIINLSEGSRSPIQESPLDFPQLKCVNVVSFDITLQYPTISSILEEHIAYCLNIPRSNICVKTEFNTLNELEQYVIKETEKETAQELVGEKRISDLLKELNKGK